MQTDLVVLAARCLLPEHALDSARFDFATLAPDQLRLGLESPMHIPMRMPSRRVSNSGQTAESSHGRQCLCWQRALVQPLRTQRVRALAPVPRTRALAPAPTTHNVCAGDTRACPSTHHAQCDGACNPCVRRARTKGCRGHGRVPQHPPRTMRATRDPSPVRILLF